MSTDYKTVSGLLADIESVGHAVAELDAVIATLFRHPDVAQALTRAAADDDGGIVTTTPSQRLSAASASLREYRRLLESIADETVMRWPPATRAADEKNQQRGD